MKKAIEDRSFGYQLLLPVSIIATYCHYRRTIIRGRDNLPREGVYILAPCHQNALMEPMAVLATMRSRVVFLARADIFAQPTVRAILTFLKILPVYRIRDGKSSLSKNDAIFVQSEQVLLSGVPLCLMAEGRHNDRHQLLPLVKGMFRIAGHAQQQLGDTPLFIVPVGIDFDHYERPYSDLVVDIGDPIAVQPFMDQFNRDEPVALNQMRHALTVALQRQMHHVDSHEYYEEVYALSYLAGDAWRQTRRRRNTAWQRFVTRREIAQKMNDLDLDHATTLPDVLLMSRQYMALCRKHNLDLAVATHPWHPLAMLTVSAAVIATVAALVVLPEARSLALWVLMCNPFIVVPTHLVVRRLINDPQFRSSVNYGIRLVLSLLYFIGVTVAVGCLRGPLWAVLALATALLSARLNALLHPLLSRWLQYLHLLFVGLLHRADKQQMRRLQQQIETSLCK